MLLLCSQLLPLLDSQQVCEELLYNELCLRTQNPLESIEQTFNELAGESSSPLYEHTAPSLYIALFIEPAGEYILTCGWTGSTVVGLVCLGYPSSLVCPRSPSSPECPGYPKLS